MRSALGFVLVVVVLSLGQPSQAAILTFDGLVGNGAPFSGYGQDGFTVSPVSGSWVHMTTYGNPLPAIIFNRPATSPTITAQVQITAGGSAFTFDAVDLYSSITPIPYVFTGSLNSNPVFSFSAQEGNTFGNFVTVANPGSTATIDTLFVALSNPATTCCSNPVGLDNIVVNDVEVPEPSTLLLLGTGLSLVAYRRRGKP